MPINRERKFREIGGEAWEEERKAEQQGEWNKREEIFA